MQDPIYLITREYPFGSGEPFVADFIQQLQRFRPVIVVPAGKADGRLREMPPGATMDPCLLEGGSWGGLYPNVCLPLIGAFLSELLRHPSILVRPKALLVTLGYLVRGARVMDRVYRTDLGRNMARVICFWSNAEAFGMAMALKHMPHIRLICRSHRFDVWSNENPYGHLPYREVIMAGSFLALPTSIHAEAHLQACFPMASERIRSVPLSVDRPYAPLPFKEREERVVLTCSTARKVKRLDLVAHSILQAARDDGERPWSWIHLGQGAELIRSIITAAGSPLRMELPGPVPRAEVYSVLRDRQPDVFVNLSSSEGMPVSIMEALSMGIPVVATAAGGTAELVDDAVGAILPVEIDAHQAATAIRNVALRSSAFRKAAEERWRERVSPEAEHIGLEKALEDFLKD